MDIFLYVVGVILLIIGMIGSLVPVIPGPPVSYLGLLAVGISGMADFSREFLISWAVVAVAVTVTDIYLAPLMAKRSGGSPAATRGTWIGMLVGFIFFPPLGIFIGPFAGALIGELVGGSGKGDRAFRAALGAFAAFFIGTVLKITVCGVMMFYGIFAPRFF
ncbi:MAG: DUF456 domain-containing protein [Rikenellaceae bacterium]|nr:DUF456 domain-containing protein [Rikenellaceae bacterium]